MPVNSVVKVILLVLMLGSSPLYAALHISLSSPTLSEGPGFTGAYDPRYAEVAIIVSQDNPAENSATFCIIASGGTAQSADLRPASGGDGDAFAGLPSACTGNYGTPAFQTSSGTYVYLTAIDDGIEEVSETVTFSLYNVVGSTIGTGSVTLTITDPVQQSSDPVLPSTTASSEIVAGNTQALQTFVSNTVMPIATRLQNIVINILKPELVTEGGRFHLSPMADGYKLSGQTGRAAGNTLKNLAGWGSISMTNMENDNVLTAYDGERLAFQFGLDYMPKDNMVAGISLGYEDMDINTTFNLGHMEGEGITISPYFGKVIDDNWSVDALIGYSRVEYDQVRLAGAVRGGARITGSTAADRFFSSINFNHSYSMNNDWLLVSRAGVMYASETANGFMESNGTVNPERRTKLLQAQFGADFTYLAAEDFEPYLSVTYNYDMISSSTTVVSGGATIDPFSDNDDLLLGAGFNYQASKNSIASLELRHRVSRENFEETIYSASFRSDF